MPAPSRRNVGASLAKTLTTDKRSDNIVDTRDRVVSHRDRHAKKWEAASSDLERRAAQARTDYERADHLSRFDRAVREGKAKPPTILAPLSTEPRLWLGYCLDCDRELWTHRSRPRAPLCQRCRDKREVRRVS